MIKAKVIQQVLGKRNFNPQKEQAKQFAPSNIALIKYWGKRDADLNLPVTSSLSISLGKKGGTTSIALNNKNTDTITINSKKISDSSAHYQRLINYINLFRTKPTYLDITINTNVPIAAGLASSASIFASIILALNELCEWKLTKTELSILARLGSGSACRSLWEGFVEWHMGSNAFDSHGSLLDDKWPELTIGLIMLEQQPKAVSSTEAMQRSTVSSALYEKWPNKVANDLPLLKRAIKNKNFDMLGRTAESNALTMHAITLSSWPPIMYAKPETLSLIQKIWQLRKDGLNLYFTQDAGPNLKLLFLKKYEEIVKQNFPDIQIIQPFWEKI